MRRWGPWMVLLAAGLALAAVIIAYLDGAAVAESSRDAIAIRLRTVEATCQYDRSLLALHKALDKIQTKLNDAIGAQDGAVRAGGVE